MKNKYSLKNRKNRKNKKTKTIKNKKHTKLSNSKTKSKSKSKTYNKNGWKYIAIYGHPRERGRQYGLACAKDFKDIQKMLAFFIMETYGKPWEYFIREVCEDFKDMTKKDYPEFYEEMQGIAEGCVKGGTDTNIDEILTWNFYLSIPYWYSTRSETSVGKEGGGGSGGGGGAKMWPGQGATDHCSAIIAVGPDFTEDGGIVVAHNSFTDFIDGQYSNIVLDITPEPGRGARILMQTSPCWIWSGTDFFITSAGIIGTETTIGGFFPYKKRIPIGYRIRTAMQYGKTLDDYTRILLEGNSGDYANSWLFGNIHTNEILRIELGLEYHNIERTKNGYFIGFNAAYDPRIRNLECVNSGFYDIRRHQGARRVRLEELITQYKGRLNVEIAKKIIGDHYDVYLKKANNPCSRTVCSHYDLDAREYMSQVGRPAPKSLHGALDGIVIDSKMAKQMSFWGRWGNSCGIPFYAEKFCKENIQWANFCDYLHDRPTQPWSLFK